MYKEVFQLLEGISDASLTAYVQEASMDQRFPIIRPAVIICPGGAYIGITEKEAEPVAMRFLSAGYHVFVLRYSIGVAIGRFPAPFIDAARAMLLVRENSKRWCIDPKKICLCGFSTGGHVAAVLATSWQEAYLTQSLRVECEMFKPNALILCYPLLELDQFNMKNAEKNPQMVPLLENIFSCVLGSRYPEIEDIKEWNCIKKVSNKMPPTFLWTTAEDAFVDIEETMDFVKALANHHVPYEFHVFGKGDHGLSLGDRAVGYSTLDIKNQINVHRWMELALNWLEQNLEQ